ncbi:MAG TPA: PP2C family protein-serine/threonine phosphatase [Bacteroidia bacterium]
MALTTGNKPLSRARLMEIKLSSLLEVTKAINTNLGTAELLEIFENVLKNQLSIGKLMLFSFDGNWKCILSFGSTDPITVNVEKDLSGIKEISFIDFSGNTLKDHFDIVVPVFHKDSPLAYVLIGDVNDDKLEVSPIIKHLPFIQTLTNIIVVAIENKKLAKENIRQAAVRKELELASEMQNMLFPTSLPSDDKLEIDARYMPHQQVGGDYYDFIMLNENEVAFCVADVSGKGVAAALLMSNFQANLRILFNHTTSLSDLVKELNTKVMNSAKGEKFITLFIAKLNLVTKTLTYINAGHNPPLLMSEKSVSLLKIGTTGLGMLDELMKVKEGIVHLNNKTTIVCYTDGVTELENEDGQDFGIDSLKKVMLENNLLPMKELNNRIIYSINKHKGSRNYIDDIALFSVRVF